MLWAAERIEPERRQPYMHGSLAIAVIVPAALLWSLIVASMFTGSGDIDSSSLDLQIYGP